MTIESDLFPEAIRKIWLNSEPYLRELIGQCEIGVGYIDHGEDSAHNNIERRLCFEAENKTVFNKLSKQLETLSRRVDSVCGDTSISLYLKGSHSPQKPDLNPRCYVIEDIIEIGESNFCICSSEDLTRVLVINQKWLSKIENKVKIDIWELVLENLESPLTQALLKQQGHLIELSSDVARIGFKNYILLRIARERLANIQAAFEKVCQRKITVNLIVSQEEQKFSNSIPLSEFEDEDDDDIPF